MKWKKKINWNRDKLIEIKNTLPNKNYLIEIKNKSPVNMITLKWKTMNFPFFLNNYKVDETGLIPVNVYSEPNWLIKGLKICLNIIYISMIDLIENSLLVSLWWHDFLQSLDHSDSVSISCELVAVSDKT